jgi:hypothetical protein
MQVELMTIKNKLVEAWTEFKIWMIRAQSYITMINNAMLVFLMIKASGLSNTYFIPIMIGSVILMSVIGWSDIRFGFFHEEQRRSNLRNPYITKIDEDLQKIKKHLNIPDETK